MYRAQTLYTNTKIYKDPDTADAFWKTFADDESAQNNWLTIFSTFKREACLIIGECWSYVNSK